MGKWLGIRLALGCFALGWASLSCVAQYTPPPPPLTTLPPCPLGKDGKPNKKLKGCDPTVYSSASTPSAAKPADGSASSANQSSTPRAADQFPFPGEQQTKPSGEPAAQAFPYPGSDHTEQTPADSDVPHDPAAEKKAAETPAGKAYPFPGGTTADMPVDPDLPAGDKEPAGASSSSSSSSNSASSSAPADSPSTDAAPGPKGEYDDDDSTTPKLKDKHSKKIAKPQTDSERVDEDLSVARYYGQSGNKMGAYLRAKDAVKTQPDYAEGHFVLGEAARRLGKNDEAVAEFTTYLKLAPDGEHAKAAEKSTAELH
jgi:hypothetical protein